MKKRPTKVGIMGKYLNLTKSYLWQTHSQHTTQQWEAETLTLKYGTRQGCPFSPFLFNIVLEVLVTGMSQGKKKKKYPNEKEVGKLSLYVDYMLHRTS